MINRFSILKTGNRVNTVRRILIGIGIIELILFLFLGLLLMFRQSQPIPFSSKTGAVIPSAP